MSNENENQLGIVKSTKSYFEGVKSEWRKITWPLRQQVIAETAIVLVVVIIITAFVYSVDIVFKGLFKFLNLM